MANSRLAAIEKRISEKDVPAYASSRTHRMFDPKYPEFTPQEGENFINILAPVDPERYFGMRVFIHYNIGNEHFLCPRGVKKEPCPSCEEADRRKNKFKAANPDSKLPKEIIELYPTPRMVYLIVDTKDASTIDKGVQVFAAADKKVDAEGVLPLCQSRRGQDGPKDVSDPELRLDVTFIRTGKSLGTTYSGFAFVESQINAEEFYEDRPEKFEDILNFATYEEIAKELKSKLEGQAEGQAVQEAPPKRVDLKPEITRTPVSTEPDVPIDDDEQPKVRGLRTEAKRDPAPVSGKEDKLSEIRNRIRGDLDA